MLFIQLFKIRNLTWLYLLIVYYLLGFVFDLAEDGVRVSDSFSYYYYRICLAVHLSHFLQKQIVPDKLIV